MFNRSALLGACQPVCSHSRQRGCLPAFHVIHTQRWHVIHTQRWHFQTAKMVYAQTGMTHAELTSCAQCLANENAELRTRLAQMQQDAQAGPPQPSRLTLPSASGLSDSLGGIPPRVGEKRARAPLDPGSLDVDWDLEPVSAHGLHGLGGLQAGGPRREESQRVWSPEHAAPSCVSGVLPVTGGCCPEGPFFHTLDRIWRFCGCLSRFSARLFDSCLRCFASLFGREDFQVLGPF